LLRKGEKTFKRAIELAQKRPAVYQELAFMYVSTNRNMAKAKELAEKAVSLDPTAQNYFALGITCSRNSDPANALSAIEKAIELDPDNAEYRKKYNMIKGRK